MKAKAKEKFEEAYYRAMTRDPRFDGRFFIGVKTTGIYCRPICPARPKRENVEFFPSPLAAEQAGYRPCLRCRPESAPFSAAWNGKSAVVQRALRLIAEQRRIECNEEEFAGRLGVSARHLRRLFEQELGKTPKQIADQERLDFARKLLVETGLPITEIAFASGFQSVRRFNDAILRRFGRAPKELRKGLDDSSSGLGGLRGLRDMGDSTIQLNLTYRPPLDWQSALDFYRSHGIPGVEQVVNDSYERVFRCGQDWGVIRVSASPAKPWLNLRVRLPDWTQLFFWVQRLRKVLDLDADPLRVGQSFANSRILAPLAKKHAGLRLIQGWDPFETVIGTVLGQLVSTAQARQLVGQLVESYGDRVEYEGKDWFLFPRPEVLARSTLDCLRTTQVRKTAIREFARRFHEGELSLDAGADFDRFRENLRAIPGVGIWTAEYASLRAMGDPDAFPGSDLILKRVLDTHPALKLELTDAKPWRGYAALYPWKEFAHSLTQKGKRKS